MSSTLGPRFGAGGIVGEGARLPQWSRSPGHLSPLGGGRGPALLPGPPSAGPRLGLGPRPAGARGPPSWVCKAGAPTYRRGAAPTPEGPVPVGPVDLPASPPRRPLPQTPARRGPATGPAAATSASRGCQGKQSFRKAGVGGGRPRKLRRACQLPAVGFRFRGAGEGGPRAGVGGGRSCSEPGLFLVGSGAGSPRGLLVCPCLSAPAPCPAPAWGPSPHSLASAGLPAWPGLVPSWPSGRVAWALDPSPGPVWTLPCWALPVRESGGVPRAPLSKGWGSPGREARLGLAFPVASPAFLGRGRKGVGGGSPASFWGAWCGEGGRRALEGLLEEGAHAAGGCWLGECPLPPRGSPGPPTWPCPSLHTAPTGNSPPQEAGCACTVGTVSNSAECNLSPLPWGPVVTAVPWALSLTGHLISAPCLPFLVSRYLHLRVSLMA